MKTHKILSTVAEVVVLVLIVSGLSVTLAEVNTEEEDTIAQYMLLEHNLWTYLNESSDSSQEKLKRVFDDHWEFVIDHKTHLDNLDHVDDIYNSWVFSEEKDYLMKVGPEYGYEEHTYDLWRHYATFKAHLIKITKWFRDVCFSLYAFNKAYTLSPPEASLSIFNEEYVKSVADILQEPTFTIRNESMLMLFNLTLIIAESKICDSPRAPQEFVHPLFSFVTLTNLKYYMIMQLYWMILNIQSGTGNSESQLDRENFKLQSQSTRETGRLILKLFVTRTIRRCEPKEHKKGVSYEEITRFLQLYIENEVNLNEGGTCTATCEDYLSTKIYGCYDSTELCNYQPKCNGNLYNCLYLTSSMEICPSNPNSDRQYDSIKIDDVTILGENRVAENSANGLLPNNSFCGVNTSQANSWIRGFVECSYCGCRCDEQGLKSDRFFSLRSSLSDVENNMVVTGIRFKKVNRVLHLQIQQGQLLPGGKINASTTSWKDIDAFDVSDTSVKEGTDFHTLTYAKRAVDLDNIVWSNPDYVVTGARFRLFKSHLNLEVHITEFNFIDGLLYAEKSGWASRNESEARQKLYVFDAEIPSKNRGPENLLSSDYQYVTFSTTEYLKDAGQTTIPFIDIQEVVADPPVLLSGLGIYHKRRKGYGGFIAPKLVIRSFLNMEL